MTYVLFTIGIVLLIKGADWLVDGASSLAKKLGVPALVIGLTIVAFGTSMPELIVSLLGAFSGETGVAFGNVIGSNIANLLLILGIAALISPPKLQNSTIWKEIPFSLLAAFVLLIIANDLLIDGIDIASLTRVDGIILILFFVIFIYYVFEVARSKRNKNKKSELEIEPRNLTKIAVLIIAGVVGLFLGGRWTVDGAVSIAQALGVSDFLIAATVVAVGTSLPELVTSIRAAFKKNFDMAVGNVVGSNIFNVFWILGATALVAPIEIPTAINFDIIFLALITLLFFLFMFVGERHRLDRWQAILFLLLYGGYLAFIIARG